MMIVSARDAFRSRLVVGMSSANTFAVQPAVTLSVDDAATLRGSQDAVSANTWRDIGAYITRSVYPPSVTKRLDYPITVAGNADRSEPIGQTWRGVSEAASTLSALRDFYMKVSFTDVGPTDRYVGLTQREYDAALKTCRLDGLPTGAWCDARGYVQTNVSDVKQRMWLVAMREVVSYASRWEGKNLPGMRSPGMDASEGINSMDSVDISKYKGLPSADSGVSYETFHASLAIAAHIRRDIKDAAAIVAWISTHMNDYYGHGIAAQQFFRLQSGYKPVPVWQYEPSANGPKVSFYTLGYYPKIRDIWALPMWLNLSTRHGAGLILGRLRATPHALTRPHEVWAYLSTVARVRNTTVHQAWISEDLSGYDKSICTEAYTAAMIIMSELDPAGARVYEEMRTVSVLVPRMRPSDAAYVYARNRAQLSGSSFTTSANSLINITRCVLIHAAYRNGVQPADMGNVTMKHIRDVLTSLGNNEIGIVVSGDDTLTTNDMPESTWSEYNRVLGFETKRAEGVNYLAKDYGLRGTVTNSIARLIQNFLFREQRFVNTSEWMTLLSIITMRHLLTNHPSKHVFDAFIRTMPDYYSRVRSVSLIRALSMSIEDIPSLIKRAVADAHGDLQRIRQTVDALQYFDIDAYEMVTGALPTSTVKRVSMRENVGHALAMYPSASAAYEKLVEIGERREEHNG